MLIVRIQGGLGNQMFQFAAGLEASFRRKSTMKLDMTAYDLPASSASGRPLHRHPDILDFNISSDLASREEVATATRPRFGALGRKLRQFKYKVLVDYYVGFHRGLLAPDVGGYMDGYFQTERCFMSVSTVIRNLFTLKEGYELAATPAFEAVRKAGNTVSIHFRRGDFVSEPNRKKLDVCGAEYYHAALNRVRQAVGNVQVIVFSDDTKWVRNSINFDQEPIYAANLKTTEGTPLSAAQELILMSRCSHHIIPNSTFSWWGAWLNPSSSKVVVAPSIWTRQRPIRTKILYLVVGKGWRFRRDRATVGANATGVAVIIEGCKLALLSGRFIGFARRMLARAGLGLLRKKDVDALRQAKIRSDEQALFPEFLGVIPPDQVARCLPYLGMSRAQLHQDLFVLLHLEFMRGGFFVEFGATDGISLSNTSLLQTQFGWTGILAEPGSAWQPALQVNRKGASLDFDCVWSRTGDVLTFREAEQGEYSTVERFVGVDEHARERANGRSYEVQTVSLRDLLQRYNAPRQIDYLSMDTEGSEFEIIREFDFTEYQFKVITVEHNFNANRQSIFDLLSRHGYRRVNEAFSRFDDWYVRV